MRKLTKLPSISNVGAGLTATLNCPLGLTYDMILVEYTGVTRAQLKDIEVVINGKVIQTFASADELQDLNDFYGRDDIAGYVTLYFARPEMDNVTMQRMTALGTADVQTLSVNIDIDAAAAAPVVKAHAVLSERQPLGLITKVKAFPMSSAVAGEIEIDNIPRGQRVQAIHLFKSDITNIEIEMSGQKIYEGSKALGEVLQKQHGRAPVTAKATHLDTQLEGDSSQALITAGASDFRVRPTLATAGAVRVVVEYLDGLAGI